jgi:hypothetical protein
MPVAAVVAMGCGGDGGVPVVVTEGAEDPVAPVAPTLVDPCVGVVGATGAAVVRGATVSREPEFKWQRVKTSRRKVVIDRTGTLFNAIYINK